MDRARLYRDGPQWTRSAGDFEVVSLPREHGDVLRDLMVAEGARTIVEIGLAYGASALAIAEAGPDLHVVVDPFQGSVFRNTGWDALRAAAPAARLIEEPSSAALPRLIADGFRADAAFVDGSHRFHEVFLDLYFLRKLVRPGGLIVLDDHWWPSVGAAIAYWVTNLGWQQLPTAGDPRLCALRLPDELVEPAFEDFRQFG